MPDAGTSALADPLRHHGDAEVGERLLDFAVNVHPGPRPSWLEDALRRSLAEAHRYPDPTTAEAVVAARHGRAPGEVLATAGAAEAFTLVARWRPWVRPVVVHPQFTEPHAALRSAGADVAAVVMADFRLDPDLVPDDADLVVVGNPTNPTGVLHPAATVRRLLRPGRVVLVDEAFMDAVPGELESMAAGPAVDGLLVARSLTKLWGIPGVRAGYLLGDGASLDDLRRLQTPWSVSAAAIAAMVACCTEQAGAEAVRRAAQLLRWRDYLELALDDMGVERVPSSASFVLTRVGRGVHQKLRDHGIAVRRADTFPGLDDTWVRIAVRPEPMTDHLVSALAALLTRMP